MFVCALFLVTGSAYGQSGQPVPVPVCERTPQVRDAIKRERCPNCSCQEMTPDRLGLQWIHELSLARKGLTSLKAGDLSGLSSLEKLDLSGNRLKALPENLPSELGSLKGLRLDLSLFTELPESILNPLLERPGFTWEITYPALSCGPYQSTAKEEAPSFAMSELETALQLPPSHGEVRVRAWKARKGVYLVGVFTETGDLDLFALSVGADKRLSLQARAEHPVKLAENELSFAFDLAPYRLTESEVGFGLRRIHDDTYVGNNISAEGEELQVFRIHGDKIELVLKTVVYGHFTRLGPPISIASNEGVDPEEWKGEDWDCWVISVARSKTNGVFNWVKVKSSERSRSDRAKDQRGEAGPAVVFRWNGERYEAGNDNAGFHFFRED